MADAGLLAAIRAGAEALDRGIRGPGDDIARLHAAGWLTAPLPDHAGGRGWGTSSTGATACREALAGLGGASLPVARLFEGHVNALALILRHGNRAQQADAAAIVGGGGLLGVWGADSEEPVRIAGSGDQAHLVGTKLFASGLGDVALALVTARAAAGLCLVIVPARDPVRADHAAWDVDGMVGSRSGRFRCDGLSAAGPALLGAPDALFTEPDFHGGIWRMIACYAGAMRRLAELAAAAPPPAGDAMISQARLGAITIEAETAMLWTAHAAGIVEAGTGDPGGAVATTLFAREAVEAAASRQLALIERAGGTGIHARRSEAGRLMRDLRFYLRQADLDGKLAMAMQLRRTPPAIDPAAP